jgi:hypothetical protein
VEIVGIIAVYPLHTLVVVATKDVDTGTMIVADKVMVAVVADEIAVVTEGEATVTSGIKNEEGTGETRKSMGWEMSCPSQWSL